MPDIVDFPGGLPFGDRSDPQLVFNTRSGGVSINGFEQIISPLSQRWEWSVSIPIHKAHKARGLRAFLAQMRGRFNYARIRMCDQYRINRREMGAVPGFVKGQSVPHSDGAYFSDGTGYEMAHGTTALPSPPVAGQTTLTVDSGFRILPGTFFSIDYWLYVVTEVEDATPTTEMRTSILASGTGTGFSGYSNGGLFPPTGGISREPVVGISLVAFVQSTLGGSVVFSGGLEVLTGAEVYVDGVHYPFSSPWQNVPGVGVVANWGAGQSPNLAAGQNYTIELRKPATAFPPQTIHFEPPLRRSGGEEIDWDATVLWQLASDRTGTTSLRQGRFGSVTLELVEPINR